MYSIKRINLSKGFTLIELILVVAMIGFSVMFSATIGSGFLWRTDLSQATYIMVMSLHRAQVWAQAQKNDQDWGVHIEDNQLTLFQGNDFQNRNLSLDEEYDLGSVVAVDPVDVVYLKFSGKPSESLSEIELTANGENSLITINSEGIINY